MLYVFISCIISVCLSISLFLSLSLSLSLSLAVSLSVFSVCLFLSLSFSYSLSVCFFHPPSLFVFLSHTQTIRDWQLLLIVAILCGLALVYVTLVLIIDREYYPQLVPYTEESPSPNVCSALKVHTK